MNRKLKEANRALTEWNREKMEMMKDYEAMQGEFVKAATHLEGARDQDWAFFCFQLYSQWQSKLAIWKITFPGKSRTFLVLKQELEPWDRCCSICKKGFLILRSGV